MVWCSSLSSHRSMAGRSDGATGDQELGSKPSTLAYITYSRYTFHKVRNGPFTTWSSDSQLTRLFSPGGEPVKNRKRMASDPAREKASQGSMTLPRDLD